MILKTHRAIRLSFAWGMGWGFVLQPRLRTLQHGTATGVYQPKDACCRPPVLFWILCCPFRYSLLYMGRRLHRADASRAMRNSMILAFVIFIVTYFATILLGNHGTCG